MNAAPPRSRLISALRARLSEIDPAWRPAPELAPLSTSGLAHDHLRVVGTQLLLRVPKQSQMALAAADNLHYQAACFTRSAPSGHTPRLHAVLEPAEDLPMGALLVDCIQGQSAKLPEHLSAVATTLASIHALPLPPAAVRPPLLAPDDPRQAMLEELAAQAVYLEQAGLERRSLEAIRGELRRARELAGSPPVSLISFDAHPGNFVIDGLGRAWLVDLEKGRYSQPGFDLAHATLYTSTTWDRDSYAELSVDQVAEFYGVWLERVPGRLADSCLPWLMPMRRLMWLWSVTWCAKWRVQSAAAAKADMHRRRSTEDWSAELSEPDLVAHVAERVDHYLSPGTVDRVRADWLGGHALSRLLSSP